MFELDKARIKIGECKISISDSYIKTLSKFKNKVAVHKVSLNRNGQFSFVFLLDKETADIANLSIKEFHCFNEETWENKKTKFGI